MRELKVMQIILNRHIENNAYYQKCENSCGVSHSENMIFDWTVRIAVVESFHGKQQSIRSSDSSALLFYSSLIIGFLFLIFTYYVEYFMDIY